MAADPIAFQLGPNGVDYAALQRKQALIDALTKQAAAGANSQGQMVSGHYIKPGLLGAMLPLIQTLAAKHAQGKVDAGMADIAGQRATAMAQALQQYQQQRNGTAGQDATGGQPTMTTEDAGNLLNNDQAPEYSKPATGPAQSAIAPIAADPFGAATKAAGSQFPQIATIGNEDLKAQLAGQLTPKELLAAQGASVPSRVAAATGGGAKALEPETFDAPGQVGIDPTTGKPILGQRDKVTGKVTFAPAGSNISIDNTPRAGQKLTDALAEQQGAVLKKSYDDATSASRALDALGNAHAQLDAGIKSGSGADTKLALAKWGKALGLSDDPSIVNTEAYRGAIARETLAQVKNLGSGAGISNADRDFAEKMTGGSATLDDKSMARLLNIAQAAQGNIVVGHSGLLNRLGNTPNIVPEQLDSFKVPFQFKMNDGVGYDQESGKFYVKPVADAPTGHASGSGARGSATNPMTPEEYLAKLQGK